MLVKYKRTSPLHRGFLMEMRERYPEHVSTRRYPNKTLFKSGGELVILNAKEKDWENQMFDALYIQAQPDTMMPFELRELYERVKA